MVKRKAETGVRHVWTHRSQRCWQSRREPWNLRRGPRTPQPWMPSLLPVRQQIWLFKPLSLDLVTSPGPQHREGAGGFIGPLTQGGRRLCLLIEPKPGSRGRSEVGTLRKWRLWACPEPGSPIPESLVQFYSPSNLLHRQAPGGARLKESVL